MKKELNIFVILAMHDLNSSQKKGSGFALRNQILFFVYDDFYDADSGTNPITSPVFGSLTK